MSRPRKSDRWNHRLYKVGFCLPIGRIAYTEINGIRKSTGLLWNEENKDRGLAILETRIIAHFGTNLPARPSERKLLDVVEVFVQQELKGEVSDNVRGFYKLAFTHYFWRDHSLLDYDGIVDMMTLSDDEAWARSHGRVPLAPGTRRKRLVYAKAFFNWCVKRRWCPHNPADAFRLPRGGENDPLPFEQYEVRLLIDYFRAHGHDEMALLIEFLAITACRIMEALGITWADVDMDDIHIDGKGSRPRVFPRHMVGFERLEEILAELAKNKERNGGFLWRWKSRHTPADMLREACEVLGLAPGRSLHSLRKTAGDWWEEELGLLDRTIADLAGHSINVRRKHYRRKRKAAELRAAVSKAAETKAAKGYKPTHSHT